MSANYITDEMVRDAELDMAVAPDIIFAARLALLSRGAVDADRLIPALLAAAWLSHKELHGEHTKAAFAGLLRGVADATDRIDSLN